MGPVHDDPRWEKLVPFHRYLEDSFPLMWARILPVSQRTALMISFSHTSLSREKGTNKRL